MGTDADHDASQFKKFLEQALSAGAIVDGILVTSERERQEISDIRDSSGEFHKTFWPYIGFDVSLPIGVIGIFIEECTRRLVAKWTDVQPCHFRTRRGQQYPHLRSSRICGHSAGEGSR